MPTSQGMLKSASSCQKQWGRLGKDAPRVSRRNQLCWHLDSGLLTSRTVREYISLVLATPCVCSVAQSCPTLCNPMDCSPPGSSVHGDSPGRNIGLGCPFLLQGSSQPRDQTRISCVSCIGRQILYH